MHSIINLRYKWIIGLVILIFTFSNAQNRPFKPGEKLTYHAYYNWGLIWLHAGEVQFSVQQKIFAGNQAYYFEAIGNSIKKYDWMYKVRDSFKSYVDINSFRTLWAERSTSEGGYKAYENYTFIPSEKKIYTTVHNSKKRLTKDTIQTSAQIFDVLTAIYQCRSINFEHYKIKEKIPVKIVLDGKIYPLFLRYLGKETIKNRNGQSFRCIKFSALLVEGSIFKGGEDMNIWVTDDDNRVPILVDAKILIGSVKAYLYSMEGVKNELRATRK